MFHISKTFLVSFEPFGLFIMFTDLFKCITVYVDFVTMFIFRVVGPLEMDVKTIVE